MPLPKYPSVEVLCSACGKGARHIVSEVVSLDIEEDIQGADVLTFQCPVTEFVVKSRVYAARYQ